MAPNEQIKHLMDLWPKVGIYVYIQKLVLLRGLPSLDGKYEIVITKKVKKTVSQAWVKQTIVEHYMTALLISFIECYQYGFIYNKRIVDKHIIKQLYNVIS